MAQTLNYHMIRYGTAEGEIKFGHLHKDNVVSAVMLRSGFDFKHYITMDGKGGEDFRNGSTTCRGPGSFQVKHGDVVPKGQPAIYLDAQNGDIVIRAPKGKIRMEAIDIEMKASGPDEKTGNIILDAGDKCIMNGQVIDCKAKLAAKFFSEKTVEIVGTGVLNMYGGFMDMADGATSIKGSKNITDPVLGTQWEKQMKIGYNFPLGISL